MKKGKIYTLELKGFKGEVTVVIEDEYKSWMVCKRIDDNEKMDGHIIVRKKYIKEIKKRTLPQLKKEKKRNQPPLLIQAESTEKLLDGLQKSELIAFRYKDEGRFIKGKIEAFYKNWFGLVFINDKNEWDGMSEFNLKKVVAIKIGTKELKHIFRQSKLIDTTSKSNSKRTIFNLSEVG